MVVIFPKHSAGPARPQRGRSHGADSPPNSQRAPLLSEFAFFPQQHWTILERIPGPRNSGTVISPGGSGSIPKAA